MSWPRHDGLEVVIQKPDQTPYPVVQHNGKFIVVAEAGDVFEVSLRRGRTKAYGHSRKMLAILEIDQKGVGYRKVLSELDSTNYEGWLVPGHYNDVTPLQYRTFKFGSCEAAEGAEEVQHPDQIAAGKIQVAWYNAQETQPHSSSVKYYSSGLGAAQEQKKLPEGKKWFMAPGLQTEGGVVKKARSGFSKVIHEKVGFAVAKMEICYDTAENLLLRKVLDVSKPEHKAMLQVSASEAIKALLAGGSHGAVLDAVKRKRRRSQAAAAAAVAPGSGSRSKKARRVKAEAGVKPEQGAAVDHVDLTVKHALPAVVVGGKEVARNEVAVCDLSGGAVKWEVTKKQVVTLG